MSDGLYEGFVPNMSDIGPVNDAYFAARARTTEQPCTCSPDLDYCFCDAWRTD